MQAVICPLVVTVTTHPTSHFKRDQEIGIHMNRFDNKKLAIILQGGGDVWSHPNYLCLPMGILQETDGYITIPSVSNVLV